MGIEFKKAAVLDIELLTSTRIEVLRAANGLGEDVDMSEIEKNSYSYYMSALENGGHTAYLVFDGEQFIGAGGISYYSVMPTCDEPTGNKAYIMNMYTVPEYRRQGIAFKTLDLLIKDARSKGVRTITLEATEMGKPLYEKYGFVYLGSEMQLSREKI